MKRLLGIAMMADGVLQAMGVAGALSTFWDRSLQDQILVAAHVAVGVALMSAGRSLSVAAAAGSSGHVGPSEDVGPSFSSATSEGRAKARPYVPLALLAALILSLAEATWFDWTNAVLRAVYTAAALVIVFRKTSLPTT